MLIRVHGLMLYTHVYVTAILSTKMTVSYLCQQAKEIMQDYIPGLLENGGKMVLLMSFLEQSLMIGDKILVFRYAPRVILL